jgi:tRNA pseudouridine38-40 synthase
VLAARTVPAGWDPRRRARYKTYRYWICDRPEGSPLLAARAWHIKRPADVAAMRRGAAHLLGRHDFSAFRAAGCEASHPVRRILRLRITRRGPLVELSITADAFLYRMVRNIVGTLAEVGWGRRTPGSVRTLLRAKDRLKAGPTAPAHGLYLDKVVCSWRVPNTG